jgi:acyl-CoA synthetase (AMP-forming)/AMP-acid ligase II
LSGYVARPDALCRAIRFRPARREEPKLPDHLPTLLHALTARSSSDRLAYVFLADGTSDTEIRWTYADVAAQSAAFAAYLKDRGVKAGSRVVLAVNPSLEFIAAMYGIMLLGAVPVPSFPPLKPRELDRFCAITVDCAADAIVIDAMFSPAMETLQERLKPAGLQPALCYPDDLAKWAGVEVPVVEAAADDLALIQYTSGSTGTPKGVCLTHDNLVSNCEAIFRNMGPNPDRIVVCWLPPYHDMGLMGTILYAFYYDWPLILMSPLNFIQEPRLWLKAISDYQAVTTVGPNFALDMCTDAINAGEAEGLDLSSLTEWYCGAEPVSIDTLSRFEEAAAPLGFNPKTMLPCYGMAEATLFISGKRRGTRWHTERDPQPDGDGRDLVSCGDVDAGHTVQIVDPASGLPVPDGTTGEIWVTGRSVAAGYYRREDVSREIFGAQVPGDDRRYLRTGDLGFLYGGELYITGRIKDLIIVNARNIYPQDVEAAVGRAAPDIRRSVAFSMPGDGSERLVVLAEAVNPDDQFAAIAEAIRTSVTAEFGVGPDVHLCAKRTIPTTTSGKVRRQEAKRMFQSGEVTVIHADRRAMEYTG